jgi:purine-binding chemotaxis protein CheW
MNAVRRTPRGGIDWQDVRARLARATAATEEALRLSPERAKAVLEERARALARAPAQAPAAGAVLEVATFTLASERYGLATAHVREVVRLTDYTPVPGAPAFLAGVVNLRGDILAVFDLRPFLGVAGGGVTGLSRAIVLGGARAEFGVLADAVHEVTTVPAVELLEPPASVTGAGREYLRGVTPDALIVLDGAVLLRDARLFIDQQEEAGR